METSHEIPPLELSGFCLAASLNIKNMQNVHEFLFFSPYIMNKIMKGNITSDNSFPVNAFIKLTLNVLSGFKSNSHETQELHLKSGFLAD